MNETIHPGLYRYVAKWVEGVAARYDRQAAMEDSEAAVRRRLSY